MKTNLLFVAILVVAIGGPLWITNRVGNRSAANSPNCPANMCVIQSSALPPCCATSEKTQTSTTVAKSPAAVGAKADCPACPECEDTVTITTTADKSAAPSTAKPKSAAEPSCCPTESPSK